MSTLSKWVVAYHLLCPRCLVSWVCSGSAVSGVLCVSSREMISVTFMEDVNHPGSQEDLVRNWEPAHSLVEDAISGAKIDPRLPALSVTHLPLCLWPRGGAGPQPASSPLVFA